MATPRSIVEEQEYWAKVWANEVGSFTCLAAAFLALCGFVRLHAPEKLDVVSVMNRALRHIDDLATQAQPKDADRVRLDEIKWKNVEQEYELTFTLPLPPAPIPTGTPKGWRVSVPVDPSGKVQATRLTH
jgi:hypothetical protein